MTPTTHLYLFHLHVFVSLVAIFGMIAFMAWAIKYLPPQRLKTWALTAFVVGGIGVLITIPFCLLGRGLMAM